MALGRHIPRQPEDVLVVGFFLAVVAATAIVVVALREDSSGSGQDESSQLVHIHGLGINPEDDRLYAASHRGLFRIDGRDVAVRIGERYQDTMGFTVTGPDRFLASGHPGPRESDFQLEGKPPLLGLIESTDAGANWTSRSLLGQADFHSLALVDGLIVAYDSAKSRVLVSPNGTTWQTRSEQPLRDLTVNPDDATQMAAIDPEGNLLRSGDSGRTWAIDPTGPGSGSVVRWGRSGIWVGGADGVLHNADPTSGRWIVTRGFGAPIQALLITEGDVYAAIAGKGIMRSGNQGERWAVVYDQGS